MGGVGAAGEDEGRRMSYTGVGQEGPSAVGYPRGCGPGVEVRKDLTRLPFGKAEVRREGRRIAVLAFGSLVHPALLAGEALDATVVNMRWVKPVDADLIEALARTHDAFVTVEEHAIMGGAGSACLEAMASRGIVQPVLQLGRKDHFVHQREPVLLLWPKGLAAAGTVSRVPERFGRLQAG